MINFLFDIRLQAHTVNIFEHTKKDGLLPRLAVSPENPVYAPESFRITDIVADKIAPAHKVLRFLYRVVKNSSVSISPMSQAATIRA